MATKNLLRLYHYTGRDDYLQYAERVLHLFRRHMVEQPFGFGNLLTAVDFYVHKPREIVLVGDPTTAEAKALLQVIQQQYLPNKTVVQIDPQHQEETLSTPPWLHDVVAGKMQVDGKATVYVCHNFTCSLPVTEPEALTALLTDT